MDNNIQPQRNGIITYKEWMITLAILLIPIVNIVVMFVWAFDNNENPSKANLFKAKLTFVAISVVLSFLSFIAFGGFIKIILNNL